MGRLIVIIFCLFTYVHVSAQEILRTYVNKTPINNENINDVIISFPTSFQDDFFVPEKVVSFNNYYGTNQNELIPINHSELTIFCFDKKWRGLNLYGFKTENIMLGLMNKHNAEVGIIYNRNKLLISVSLFANVYNFNPLSTMYCSAIQNQFGINGRVSYDFNENVSVSVYGRYVTNSFYHSMASFPYVATSSFGGFITMHNEKVGIDLGVNNYFDAFNHCWQTNPIVRPTYKIGKVKMSIDVGPLMKEGILYLLNKQRVDGPIRYAPSLKAGK